MCVYELKNKEKKTGGNKNKIYILLFNTKNKKSSF